MIIHDFPIGNPFQIGFNQGFASVISDFLEREFGDYYDPSTIADLLFNSPFYAPVVIVNRQNVKTHLAFSVNASLSANSGVYILYRPELSLQENLDNMVIRYVKYEDA